MTMPRLLTIMGSGETAPTMKVPHRRVFERLAAAAPDGEVDAVMLDTPFGFQENAPDLAASTTKYFRDAVGRDVAVAGLARTDGDDVVALESAVARVRSADWVFAGPGSPTFALAHWRGTAVPDILGTKLRSGGAVVFSSAAALTIGVATVPVYEIYKVGADPYWEAGLDVLSVIGLDVAVIPHYDNAEGGHHDTRFCYLGERRLLTLERELPDGAFILGIDEHTGVIMDLDADTAEVVGKGGLTVRRHGTSIRYESGRIVPIDLIRSAATDRTDTTTTAATTTVATAGMPTPTHDTSSSLESVTTTLQQAFDEAIARRDARAAVAAALDLDTAIAEWSNDSLQSDQIDRARASLRSMIVRLGEVATVGLQDPREVLAPVVAAALDARRVAREERAFAVADALRDGLAAAGVEVRDTADGVEWHLS
ncbi:MAG: CysS/YqeB C-terminal domain-containing protein [Ilumatobacteraceae bacterium]